MSSKFIWFSGGTNFSKIPGNIYVGDGIESIDMKLNVLGQRDDNGVLICSLCNRYKFNDYPFQNLYVKKVRNFGNTWDIIAEVFFEDGSTYLFRDAGLSEEEYNSYLNCTVGVRYTSHFLDPIIKRIEKKIREHFQM